MTRTNNLNTLSGDRHMTEQEIAAENEVVVAARKNAKVFGQLYDKYFEGIFNFILRRTDDEELTADLTSQVFLKALQNLKKYEYRGLPFSAWLYRIAGNEVNKHYTRGKGRRIYSLEEERFLELLERGNEEQSFGHDQVQHLIDALNQMPTDVVEVLELRFFEERSFKEISYILGIGESGAKMRLYRAVEKLKKQFNVNWKE